MIVSDVKKLPTERVVDFHAGTSNRIIIKSDGLGYGLTKTIIKPEAGKVFQHYKNHQESCYCVSGLGYLTCVKTGKIFQISEGVTYTLNNNDPHYFEATEETVLICVFNPPLVGREVHRKDGSYSLDGSN